MNEHTALKPVSGHSTKGVRSFFGPIIGSFYILVFSLAAALPVGAQNDVHVGRNLFDHLLVKSKEAIPRIDRSEIEGSPYLNDSFTLAMVLTTDAIVHNLPVKYDIYNDLMEFKDRDQVFLLDPSPKIQKILLEKQTFVVEPYDHDGKFGPGYFILLDSVKVKLLQKKVIRFQELQPAKALQTQNTPAKYVPMPDKFYYRIGTEEAKPINNLKKMIAQFPSHQKALLAFANRRNLGKTKEDLLQLWEYYHGLEERPN
ncbi:MAG TPA: hypothetical protein PKM27_15955 [Saprospiraceae bacterium]|nr:hypothetical protein [Saprospiraceae bacterium]HNT22229.1 hypothetical protein [Saprospiraceae bacterium]